MQRQSFYQSKQSGMTLLEVLLALAILGGTVAIIGEGARLSFQNARISRDLVQAELLAESVLAKVQLGIIEMEQAIQVPIGLQTLSPLDIVEDTHALSANVTNVLWYYDLEIVDIDIAYDIEGSEIAYLVEIAVTVRRNLPEAKQPVTCRLVRWFALEPAVEEEEEQI